MSSSFQDKMTKLKQTVVERTLKNNQNLEQNRQIHTCSNLHIKIDEPVSRTSREELCIQQPIIIQKKQSVGSKPASAKKQKEKDIQKVSSSIRNKTTVITKKEVEPFVPIQIPTFEKRIDAKTINCFAADTPNNNKEIEIKIQKDDTKDKECLKKLFKKIHKLTDDLAAAQKQNMQLKIELENYKNVAKTCGNHEKIINKLEGDKYKLEVDLNLLKRLLDEKDAEIKRLSSTVAKQIIKEVVIQKPVQVQIEVPKHIPGPQRIVQKIVEVPKYIEIEKPIPPVYEPPREVTKEVIKQVPVPQYIQKPVYLDKPVYIQVPVQKRVEVPIEVPPIEVPVYLDRPFVPEEYEIEMRQMKAELEELIRVNETLYRENNELRYSIQKLTANLEILSRHNQQKNRQTQLLMQNSFDYYPISPGVDISSGSVRYSVSTHPHPRVI